MIIMAMTVAHIRCSGLALVHSSLYRPASMWFLVSFHNAHNGMFLCYKKHLPDWNVLGIQKTPFATDCITTAH